MGGIARCDPVGDSLGLRRPIWRREREAVVRAAVERIQLPEGIRHSLQAHIYLYPAATWANNGDAVFFCTADAENELY